MPHVSLAISGAVHKASRRGVSCRNAMSQVLVADLLYDDTTEAIPNEDDLTTLERVSNAVSRAS
jgi:hypothetical protein